MEALKKAGFSVGNEIEKKEERTKAARINVFDTA
jgi:hypothetical protein